MKCFNVFHGFLRFLTVFHDFQRFSRILFLEDLQGFQSFQSFQLFYGFLDAFYGFKVYFLWCCDVLYDLLSAPCDSVWCYVSNSRHLKVCEQTQNTFFYLKKWLQPIPPANTPEWKAMQTWLLHFISSK